jgi:hypothetical protein
MASSGDTITVGYWYRVGMHLVAAHAAHAVTRIKAGDKLAWVAPTADGIQTSQQITINKPGLFGGEQREGGIFGKVDIIMGTGSEPVNDYLQSRLPSVNPAAAGSSLSRSQLNEGFIPAFRGVTSLVLRQTAVAANNPNLRPWNIELFYQPAKDWYPQTERIDNPGKPGVLDCYGVNPAHMIRECLTNVSWGLGFSPLDLDDDSFRTAALTLYNEAFSLNLVWDHTASLLDFVGVIVDHIAAALYVHPQTGLFTLKLMRDDYDRNTLPVFDESNIVDLTTYERLSTAELVNQVTVIWYDNSTDRKRSATEHNTAVRDLQGGVVSTMIEYPGIGNAELASKVATRELRRRSTAFSRISIITNRDGATLKVGDVFKLNWADYGISGAIYRVGRVVYSASSSTEVTIDAVEDMFSFGQGIYTAPKDSLWEDPINEPAAPPLHQATEAPYILVERALNESPTLIGEVDPLAGFLTYQATAPSEDAFNYTLYTRTGSNAFTTKYVANFTPIARILAPIEPAITTTVSIAPDTNTDISLVKLNTYALLGDEIVSILALSETSVTLRRGVLDTVPVSHASGTILWFAENQQGYDRTEWLDGVVVQAKASTLTGKGSLDLSLAPTDTLVIKRRWYRPYPPGNVKLNGLRWPTDTTVGEPVFTWSHRDRTTQLSYYVAQDEGNFGPEAGTTYTVRVYDRFGELKRTVSGISDTSWTYLSADETADAPGPVYTVAISSVRDGVESWQAQRVLVFREGIGYGYSYGNFYGGYESPIGYGQDYGQNYGRFFG